MNIGEKATVPAEPLYQIDLQRFAEGDGAGDSGAAPAANTTSSIIPGDNYASGGPEPPENQPAELVDLEGWDFNAEPEDTDGDPAGEEQAQTQEPEPDPVPDPVKKEQSPEANAAFAEIRRQAEQAQKELQARDAWVEQQFGTTHGIHTWEQYQAAIEQSRQQEVVQKQQEIQNRPYQVAQEAYKQYIAEGYDEAMANELANAKGAAEAANLRLEALQNEVSGIKQQTKQEKEQAQQLAQQKAQEEAAKQLLQSWESDLTKLQADYGELAPKDLKNLDPAVVAKLEKGYSLEDAWYTTNRSKVLEQKEKAAAQKTLNNLDSKKHLKTEGDGGADSNASSIPLPGDTLQMYMDSGMTEKQARAFHKKLYG